MNCIHAEMEGDPSQHCPCVPVLREEIERLRAEVREMRRWTEEAARAENLNALDAQKERAAVVAYLRAAANAPHPSELGAPMLSPSGRGLLLLHADAIERGEHRREGEP